MSIQYYNNCKQSNFRSSLPVSRLSQFNGVEPMRFLELVGWLLFMNVFIWIQVEQKLVQLEVSDHWTTHNIMYNYYVTVYHARLWHPFCTQTNHFYNNNESFIPSHLLIAFSLFSLSMQKTVHFHSNTHTHTNCNRFCLLWRPFMEAIIRPRSQLMRVRVTMSPRRPLFWPTWWLLRAV